MTPSARLNAAIGVLDTYLEGQALEKSLTNWARASRYAGSKDRAAVRDIVFQCARCQNSFAFQGGSMTGRGLAIGYAHSLGDTGVDLFDGQGYGAEPLSEDEVKSFENNNLSSDLHAELDFPEWIGAQLSSSLGLELSAVMKALQSRAGIHLRVNTLKCSRATAIEALAEDGVICVPHDLATTALDVVENPRRINDSSALRDGLIELQDAASQAVCEALPSGSAMRILDFCAGGGGKSLALANKPHGEIFAHDINAGRMVDLPERASRAGTKITTLKPGEVAGQAPFDLVLCDVPCSGSGAWRRSPEGKWKLSAESLAELLESQQKILSQTQHFVGPGGTLAYATCSMLRDENEAQIARFTANNPEWIVSSERRFSPLEGGDGFYLCCLTQVT